MPVESSQPLAESETGRFKDLLIEWAKSRRLDPAAVRDNLKLVSAERVWLHDLTLLSLVETRDPNLVEAQAPADAPAGAGAPVADVWAHPSETRTDFTAAKGTYLIPATVRREDCAACGKTGSSPCDACEGRGQGVCPNCKGTGRFPCDVCKGLAKTNCLKCNGKGLLKGGTMGPGDSCPDCAGEGKVACTRCNHGSVGCNQCNGARTASCARCEAKGKRSCEACGGKGVAVKAQAFRAEFQPVSVSATAAGAALSRYVQDKLSASKKPAGEAEGGVLLTEEIVRSSGAPEPVAAAARQLLQKLAPSLSANARVCRQKLSWTSAQIVRLAGTFFDQEFVYWADADAKTVIKEKDPLQNLGDAAAQSAQAAWDAGEWSKALALARKTLSFDPENVTARRLLDAARRKALAENAVAGLAGGLAAGALAAGLIFFVENGLNKAVPALGALGALALLGAGLGAASRAFTARLPRRARLTAVFAATLGALAVSALGARQVWDPVRAADQASLDEEMKTRFPAGVSEVYWPEDLQFLEAIADRYAKSKADLSGVNAARDKQKELRAKREKLQKEFADQVAAVSGSADLHPRDKIARLKELRDLYQLQSLDVSAAEAALKKAEEELKSVREEKPRGGRISIVSNARASGASKRDDGEVRGDVISKQARELKKELKQILSSSLKPDQKRAKLVALQKKYEKNTDVAAVKKEIKKLDDQAAKAKAKAKSKTKR